MAISRLHALMAAEIGLKRRRNGLNFFARATVERPCGRIDSLTHPVPHPIRRGADDRPISTRIVGKNETFVRRRLIPELQPRVTRDFTHRDRTAHDLPEGLPDGLAPPIRARRGRAFSRRGAIRRAERECAASRCQSGRSTSRETMRVRSYRNRTAS